MSIVRRFTQVVFALSPQVVYGMPECSQTLLDNMPFVAKNMFLPRHDAEAHGASLEQCDEKGWNLQHFQWTQEEGGDDFIYEGHPFAICAPGSCFHDATGRMLLDPASVVDLMMKDQSLREHLRELGVHESLIDGTGDLLRERGEPREERVMPYHSAKPLSIAILGFPKCGTTQLAYNLGLHPHIVFSEFGQDVDAFQYGIMYASEFEKFVVDDHKFVEKLNELPFEQKHMLQVGIKSPLSIYHPERVYAAARLGLKTVICVRHPYKMQLSFFAHIVDRKEDFESYYSRQKFGRMFNVLYDHAALLKEKIINSFDFFKISKIFC